MNHTEYKRLSERTLSSHFYTDEVTQNLLHGAIGIATELGELAQALQKDDIINVGEELADIMWYIAIFDRQYNVDRTFSGSYKEELTDEIFLQSAELLDIFKKKLFYNREVDELKVIICLNAIQQQVDDICFNFDLDIEELRAKNIAKLQARFPDKFTTEAANNRDLEQERAILES